MVWKIDHSGYLYEEDDEDEVETNDSDKAD